MARYFIATTLENGGRILSMSPLSGQILSLFKDTIAKSKCPKLKDMNGNEISDLTKVSTLKGKMSNLELPDKIESSNLKKVSSLDDKVLKLELKVHQLISLLVVSWAIIVGFVAAKMI
ncbi:hypothetical protein H5410_001099 [Solanum commersonii]|uniref:Transmembrane protein n=1 Tax=Solanum commersonii TaxID=4109 RepID=A0A9J6AXZ2_SOLCO|nr:hypothetical protein H5410_001099 [Solanum commersonii]